MDRDDDIAAALPDAPPPHPLHREAAIAEALRRFDAAQLPAERPRRSGIGRPQAGALVAAGLIALIGVPAAWLTIERRTAPLSERGPVFDSMEAVAPPPASRELAYAAPLAEVPRIIAPPTSVGDAAPKPGAPPATLPQAVAQAEAMRSALARTEPIAAPVAAKAMAFNEAGKPPPPVIAPTAPADPPRPSAAPPPMEQAAADAADDASSIVVTGQHRSAGRAPSRGDWNACTVDDPQRSLDACKKLVDPAAAGAAGRAAAHVADGLSLAWQGDLRGAIVAFDQAVELSPRLALAYLNRGLAYQRSGDPDRAMADLDRAVRFAPGAARGYYNRSRLLRERGDTAHADADHERAIAIDWHYEGQAK